MAHHPDDAKPATDAAAWKTFERLYPWLAAWEQEEMRRAFPALWKRDAEASFIKADDMVKRLAIDTPRSEDGCRALLARILVNDLKDAKRQLKRAARGQQELQPSNEPAYRGPTPSHAMRKLDLYRLAEGLPEPERTVALAIMRGHSVKQIALILDCSTEEIRNRWRSAKRHLGIPTDTPASADLSAVGERFDFRTYIWDTPQWKALEHGGLDALIKSSLADGPDEDEDATGRFAVPKLRLRPGAELIPGITLVRPITAGGHGTLWAVRVRQSLGPSAAVGSADEVTEMALKLVPVSGDKGLREPQLLGSRYWFHPYLARGYFIGCLSAGWMLFLMDLAGRTLRDKLSESGGKGIPEAELFGYMDQVASAIDFLTHRSLYDKLVHRDVKPENILLHDNVAKLGDFGSAQHVLCDFKKLDMWGVSEKYSPPEFFEGLATVHSDQFSLAVTYCELRGGRRPFSTRNEVMRKQPDLEMLPECERPIVERALSPHYRNRWWSCKQFIKKLRAAAGRFERMKTFSRKTIGQEADRDWNRWIKLCRGLHIPDEVVSFSHFSTQGSSTRAFFRDASNRTFMVYLPEALTPNGHEAELAARLKIALGPGPVQPPMAELFIDKRQSDWRGDQYLRYEDTLWVGEE